MSHILTIYSAEEHLGKTTLGSNLGVSLIHETQKRVILVEFDRGTQGRPAWSMLKFPSAHLLSLQDLSVERVADHIRRHSSRLYLLTVDPAEVEATGGREVLGRLFAWLRERFDYILVDVSPSLSRVVHELLDISEIVLFVASSHDDEQPIGIVGHQNVRYIVNRCEDAPSHPVNPLSEHYCLPKDDVALKTFLASGIPFVIQSPNRRISQVIGKLARDIGGKRFGLALTGGAALGLTQLGILEVFEQNRIAIDMITGVSFGALLGAAYAAGIELRLLKHHLIDWAQTARVAPRLGVTRLFRKERFLKEAELQALCETLLHNVYFEDLTIPLHVVAIDIRSGTEVMFKEGKVLDAIKSSMRIPGLFVPFKHTERHLIDGSAVHQTPVFPLQCMGANITVAVVVTPSPKESQAFFREAGRGRLSHIQGTVRQNYALVNATFDSLMERLQEVEHLPADETPTVNPDVYIVPDVTGLSWQDFHRVRELIERGARAAEDVLPHIEHLKWG
ncbi:AAA family ATPase [candidate division KSB3 bacterium]|uniref:AAA family ATPase n=1 Tax=candidate division KSB3 bacterium TaxID=2044937 RepID=A0A9D5JZ55_9BACT|nr:AAA family ATPase [candidate division KSB3 bacterium]MBD3327039.1 AAA family ATPase [candidate division KSB3 bacterium]